MKIEKLESLRGFAAVYVMLSHASSNAMQWQDRWYGQPFRFAQEAVLLFFLLSGFVIFYSWETTRGPKNFATFLFKRFRRIYPIFLLALLVTYLIACVSVGGIAPFNWLGLLSNLVMLQGFDLDPGRQAMPFLGNGPLWSLAYEWWFYLLFYPIHLLTPVSLQKYLILALALVGIIGGEFLPNIFFHILGSFPLWWCGVEFAREYVQTGGFSLRRQAGTLGLLLATGLAYALVTWHWHRHGGPLSVITYPLVKVRHYLVCLVFVLLFFVWRRAGFFGFRWTLGPFGIFAGMSYAMYALHFPILTKLQLFSNPHLVLLDLGLRIVLVLALAFLAEELLQPKIGAWLDHWRRKTSV